MSESEIIDKIGYDTFTEINKKNYLNGRQDTLDDISIASLIRWYFYKTNGNTNSFYPNWLSKLYLNAVIPLFLVGFLIGFLMCLFVFLVFLILS